MSAAPSVGSGASGRRRTVVVVLALLAVAVGAAAGAWIDWTWWNPVYGIQLIAILGALIALFVAYVLRRRLPSVLPVTLAAAVGLGVGLALGPSRETLAAVDGTLTVRLDGPSGAHTDTTSATCQVVPSRGHISVEGQATVQDGRGLTLWITVGDMWSRGPWTRPDHIAVQGIIAGPNVEPIADDGFPTELRLTSTSRSQLTAEIEDLAGSIRFAGLESYEDGKPDVTTPVDLVGTVEWACEEPAGVARVETR